MSTIEAMLLSDHLAEALACLNRARDAARDQSRDASNHQIEVAQVVLREITQAELSIARVIGLVAGAPQ